MTTVRQIEANRRNARKSTGPNTPEGKQRSSRNALRHGLTAETVIGPLEDAEDYKSFETAIVSDFDARTALERELLLRLASLLWRLRRATVIETGLFEMQANDLYGRGRSRKDLRVSLQTLFRIADGANTLVVDRPELGLTRCFLALAESPTYALDRLSRYESILWRQVTRTLLSIRTLQGRWPDSHTRFPGSHRDIGTGPWEGHHAARAANSPSDD